MSADVLLVNWKAIDVRSNHHPPTWRGTTKCRHRTRRCRTMGEIPTQFDQSLTDDLGCAELLERKLRMLVQVMADIDHSFFDEIEESVKILGEFVAHVGMVPTSPGVGTKYVG